MEADRLFLRNPLSARLHKAVIVSDTIAEASAAATFDDSGAALFISE